MDAAQQAHWTEKGWLVVDNVVPPSLLAELNEEFDRHLNTPALAHPDDLAWDKVSFTHRWYNTGQRRPKEERHGRPRVLWGAPFYELIDLPGLTPILAELLSDPVYGHALPGMSPEHARKFRLDHDNTHFAAPFDPELSESDRGRDTDAHGGTSFAKEGTPRHEWTPDGIKIGGVHGGDPVKTRTVSVIMELAPIEEGRGGTACFSGTHRPGFPRPGFSTAEARFPPWPAELGVEIVTLRPGQALVFTEKLLHSTAMWSSRIGPRKTMFYKYQPYGLTMSQIQDGNFTIRYDLDHPALTESQRRILAWPDQWEEYGLGEYGPAAHDDGRSREVVMAGAKL